MKISQETIDEVTTKCCRLEQLNEQQEVIIWNRYPQVKPDEWQKDLLVVSNMLDARVVFCDHYQNGVFVQTNRGYYDGTIPAVIAWAYLPIGWKQ